MSGKGNISKKQVTVNMAANIVSYSANIIISFVLTPFLINTLGKETYSFYPIANTIVSYMSVLTNAMNTIASRFVTVTLVRGETENANKYFSSTLAANLIISFLLLIPMSGVVVFLDLIMEVPVNSVAAIKTLFALVFSAAIVNISASVLGIATFAKNRIDLRSFRELITAIIKLALFVILYRYFSPSIIYIGIVALVIAVINIMFQMTYTKRLLPELSIGKKYVSIKHTKEILGASCWNAINYFGNALLVSMSMILANVLYGASASGAYSIVNTVPQFINGVISVLVGIFYPVITYKYAQDDKTGVIKEIKTTQRLIGSFSCAVIAVFSSLAAEFFKLWTPGEDALYLSRLSFFTILPHYVISCMWSLTNLNVVMNKVKIPALFTLLSGIANVVIAYFVSKVTDYGVISLPIISAILQIIWVGIFIPLYACKNLQVKWHTFYPILGKAIVCSIVVFVLIMKIKGLFDLTSWLKFITFGLVAGVVSLLAYIVVIIGKEQLKQIAKSVMNRRFN